ncbi:hypothetical protein SAMN02745130_00344 [Thiothrix eikelboomii]|uniref:Uncharacterized protein n=1 Tax=Thiothrix eikelboomii TaxID=92487 RepID=A0A1T4VUU8_9GAMM|nr:hypothetical protein [Thiothrix eikelboomii]SKA68726.1 hypothetical protein SAMN02745130_00344 [Thiothrix eikelboomii]
MQKLILKGGFISLVVLLVGCTEQDKPTPPTAAQATSQPTQPEITQAMSALSTPPEATQPPTQQTSKPTTEAQPTTVIAEEKEKEQEPECE